MKQARSDDGVRRSAAAVDMLTHADSRHSSRHGLADQRRQTAVQRRLQTVVNDSARLRHLESLQAIANPPLQRQGVVQLNDDSEKPYAKHKDGTAGESKWDSSNSGERKNQIWSTMGRDDYQQATEGFLGATGGTAVPTTNHILAKGQLPQFEFSHANLRFGPNGILRFGDPDQRPDYNIDHDGALTPRSREIADLFESGNKAGLKEAMSTMKPRPHEPKDFDQWYISLEQWKRIAAGWKDHAAFWEQHGVDYFTIDYTKPTGKGHKGEAVKGIPWAATRKIPDTERDRFQDMKHFILRGGQVRNENQKKIVGMFQELKSHGAQIEVLLKTLGLSDMLEHVTPLSEADIGFAKKKLPSRIGQRLDSLVSKLDGFMFKVDNANAELAQEVARTQTAARNLVAETWSELFTERLTKRRAKVLGDLGERYRIFLASQESEWVREFQVESQNRQAQYNMAEAGRSRFLLGLAKEDLQSVLAPTEQRTYTEARPLQESDVCEVLATFETKLAKSRGELESKIKTWSEEREKPFDALKIREQLQSKYGINALAKKQPEIHKKAEFLADAKAWLGAKLWTDKFQRKMEPKAADEKLYKLLENLYKRYESK